ncbi:ALF repeat-containing protein [Streptomyces sp. NPDC057424]|uniref:ALF repeat-containing protein n=1 Tax=Streptomyces sp. NPDC057424 TaxID=3346127 RepID=UPI0036A868ED
MRLTRAALTIAATALTPALLLTTPAFAADTAASSTTVTATSDTGGSTTPVDEMSDDDVRVAIARIIADPDTGRAVRAAAQAALDGTVADQRYFLETGRWVAQAEDDRVAVARILFTATKNGDKAVIREANEALDAGTPEALRAFLETGYRLAQFEDDRVATFRILHIARQNNDKAVIREANEALETGTPEALRAFLETGYRLAQFEDDRVATFRILHIARQNNDKAVIREANEALETGTPEALRAFLETGYRLAQAEDDRVAVARILADPAISDALRAAAEDVIDGTPEELRYFLEVGRYEVDG